MEGFQLIMEGLTCRLSSFFLESWKNLEKSPEHICYPGSEWRIWAVFFSFSGMTLSLQQFFFQHGEDWPTNPMWWLKKRNCLFNPFFLMGQILFWKKNSWSDITYFNCEVETSTNCMPKETTATAAAFQLCRSSGISSYSWQQQGNWDNKNDHWLSSA